MSEHEPLFVTCLCTRCSGKIEFDSSGLDPDFTIQINCPHCGEPTELSIPKPHSEATSRPKRGKRLTLTSSQIDSPIGSQFVRLLCEIGADGLITQEEIQQLRDWTSSHLDSDIPAIPYLNAIAVKQLKARGASRTNVYDLQLAMERVLPKLFRVELKQKRQSAYRADPEHQPTEKQLKFIADLGGIVTPGMTRFEASMLIDDLLDEQENARHGNRRVPDYSPPSDASNRQMMVLRFWNRLDLANSSREEISEWLDDFYQNNPARREAWELFKREKGDDGSQRDPAWVPVAAGEEYLTRLGKLGSSQQKPRGCFALALAFCLVVVAGLMLLRTM
jgi:hypothetical protein